jgi:hypothetical protein
VRKGYLVTELSNISIMNLEIQLISVLAAGVYTALNDIQLAGMVG